MGGIKLTIELVPRTCSYSNVRSLLPAKEWNRLRKASYLKADYVCEICGDTSLNQGRRYPVECHEIWVYDDVRLIQKLIGLTSLCSRCHMVKHFGRSTAVRQQHVVMKHLEDINGWTHKKAVKYLAEVYRIQKERSKRSWGIDLSVLSEEHQVDNKLILEAQKKRQ